MNTQVFKHGNRKALTGLALTAITAVCVPTLFASVATGSPGVAAASAHKVHAGLAGRKLVLLDNQEFTTGDWDVASDDHGNTYIGWLADSSPPNASRTVYLCTIRAGGHACAGGVQSIDSLDTNYASDLNVLSTPSGQVSLVWYDNPIGGSSAEIVVATSNQGAPASSPTVMATPPKNGALYDAVLGPDGSIWATVEPAIGAKVDIYPGLTNPAQTVTAPWTVGGANIAFAGSTPIIAVNDAGAISQPVAYAHRSGTTWSSFTKLAGTWSVGYTPGLVGTKSGVRLISGKPDASYQPVISHWTGSSFSKPTQFGDGYSCTPGSSDAVTDASGRVADVTNECGKITAYNVPGKTAAATVRFSAGGTVAGNSPQIATTPSGHGWVVYAIEDPHETAHYELTAAPIQLPALTVHRSKSSSAGRVTVTGPASCLPTVETKVGIKASPAPGWSVAARSLKLGHTTLHSSLNGSSLKPAEKYTLVGTAVFSRKHAHKKVKVGLPFRTCPRP